MAVEPSYFQGHIHVAVDNFDTMNSIYKCNFAVEKKKKRV
jgi:hypothetical protein